MEPFKNLVKSNKEIHESNLKLIEITQDIYDYMKDKPSCHECKKQMVQEDEILFKHDVMQLLKISSPTYYRYKEQGILVPMKMGRKDYYLKSSLHEALMKRKWKK